MTKANANHGIAILVVDDDDLLRELFGDWLEAEGYTVRKAPNCQAAFQALEEAPVSLVVSDMFMPGPCGAAAIAQFRRAAPYVPVIALSGYFNAGVGMSAGEALAAGAARALAKPLRREQLLTAVSELIGPPVTVGSASGDSRTVSR
jgi:CheY-like chemotaxis protein